MRRNTVHAVFSGYCFPVFALMAVSLFMPEHALAQTRASKGDIQLSGKISGHINLVPITVSMKRNETRQALEGLAEGFRTFTRVTPKLDQNIKLDDPRVMRYPFLFINTPPDSDMLETEKKRLGDYLKSGGFVFFEFDLLAYRGLKKALPEDIRLRPLPENHAVYKEPFEVDPKSWNEVVGSNLGVGYTADLPSGPYMIGLFYKGKLVGVYSYKGVAKWNRRLDTTGSSDPINTNIRFGINMLYHATKMYNGE